MSLRRAFTLVELLVVIAVIAILATLLLPVLSKAKNRAAETTDINNLKQVSTSVHVYTADNNDVLPPPNWDRGIGSITGWLYQPDENSPVFNVKTGLLWPILQNAKVYFCPLDGPGTVGFSERQQQISSYVMNGAVIGYGFQVNPPVKLTAMQPGDCAYWEADERYPDYFNDGANVPAEGISERHQNGGIQTEFDGTTSHVRQADWYADVANTNKNWLWCYPGSADGGGPDGHNP